MVDLRALLTRTGAIFAASSTMTHWGPGAELANAVGPLVSAGIVGLLAVLVENRMKADKSPSAINPMDLVLKTAGIFGGSWLFGSWPTGRQISSKLGPIPIMGLISFITLVIEDRIKHNNVLSSPSPRRLH